MILMFSAIRNQLIIGLTSGNVDKLLAGKPAVISGPYPMRVQEVIVVYGRDKPHIIEQLEAVNIEIPEDFKVEAAKYPT